MVFSFFSPPASLIRGGEARGFFIGTFLRAPGLVVWRGGQLKRVYEGFLAGLWSRPLAVED